MRGKFIQKHGQNQPLRAACRRSLFVSHLTDDRPRLRKLHEHPAERFVYFFTQTNGHSRHKNLPFCFIQASQMSLGRKSHSLNEESWQKGGHTDGKILRSDSDDTSHTDHRRDHGRRRKSFAWSRRHLSTAASRATPSQCGKVHGRRDSPTHWHWHGPSTAASVIQAWTQQARGKWQQSSVFQERSHPQGQGYG